MHPVLYQEIRAYRAKMPIGQRNASLNYRFNFRYPHKAEKAIEAFLSRQFSDAARPAMLSLKNTIPNYEKARGVLRIDYSEADILSGYDEYEKYLTAKLDDTPDKDYGILIAIIIALLIADWDRFSMKYAGKVITLPSDLNLYTPEFIGQLRNYIKQEVGTFFQKTKSILQNDLAKKKVYQETYSSIFTQFKHFIITRSKYLARNFVSNTYSRLQEALFTAMGMPIYRWSVMMDERLRGNPAGKYANKIPSHYVMTDILCQWANDTVYSLEGTTWVPRTEMMELKKPGRATNCRCVSQIFIKNDLIKIDRSAF